MSYISNCQSLLYPHLNQRKHYLLQLNPVFSPPYTPHSAIMEAIRQIPFKDIPSILVPTAKAFTPLLLGIPLPLLTINLISNQRSLHSKQIRHPQYPLLNPPIWPSSPPNPRHLQSTTNKQHLHQPSHPHLPLRRRSNPGRQNRPRSPRKARLPQPRQLLRLPRLHNHHPRLPPRQRPQTRHR